MRKTARLKFFIGLLFVIAISASLFVYLDYSMSRVRSNNAQLESDTYTVGIDYSGVMTNQYVQEGSYIDVGDPLFEIRSSTLAEAIEDDEVAQNALVYTAKPDGTVLIAAAAPGKVQTVSYKKGAFVPANSQIATINVSGGLYVSATYVLSSPDYSQLTTNSRLYAVMPDGKRVEATVYDIALKRVDNEVRTTVRAKFNNEQINTDAFAVGTPLDTVLELTNDTFYEQILALARTTLTPASER